MMNQSIRVGLLVFGGEHFMLHLIMSKFLNAGQGLPNRGAAKGTFHMPCNGLSSIKGDASSSAVAIS
jgi:hypothetical protein